MYLEGLSSEMAEINGEESQLPLSHQPSGGRSHKIEHLVPIRQIAGNASWMTNPPDLPISVVK